MSKRSPINAHVDEASERSPKALWRPHYVYAVQTGNVEQIFLALDYRTPRILSVGEEGKELREESTRQITETRDLEKQEPDISDRRLRCFSDRGRSHVDSFLSLSP